MYGTTCQHSLQSLTSVQAAAFTDPTKFDPKRPTKDYLYPDGVFR